MNKLKIKTKLFILLSCISAVLIVIGIFTYYSFNKTESLNELETRFKNIQSSTLELRKHEKDFLLREVTNEDFFKSGESKYITNFNKTIESIQGELQSLKKDKYVIYYKLESDISKLTELFNNYSESFIKLTNETKNKGYKDYGSIGEMRKAVHAVDLALESGDHNKNLAISMLTLRKHEKDYLIRQDVSYKEKYIDELNTFLLELEKDTNMDIALKQALAKNMEVYKVSFFEVIDEDAKIGMTEKEGLTGELRSAVHQVEPVLAEIGTTLHKKIDSSIQLSVNSVIGLIIVGIIIAIFLSLTIILSITKALNYANSVIESISKGDLTQSIIINSKDEIAKMLGNLKIMSNKLNEIIASIMAGSANISSASFEMSSTSQELSQGSNEQASSAEEVSSSMEEMASNIQQNTDNAQQTERIALKAAEDIREGSISVNMTVESMKQIADKIQIIGEIARQTNILALNAAVEAARAGEHGKGFAVVAAEVRKLAERSQISANEIDELSKSSVSVAEKSGKLLASIVPDIEKTAKLVQEVSAASIEQSSGADQVNNAVQQLNQVTQQNAAASEELATSSEELSSQAEQLKEMIAFFKINDSLNKKATKSSNKKTTLLSNNFSYSKKPTHENTIESTALKGVTIKMDKEEIKESDFENF